MDEGDQLKKWKAVENESLSSNHRLYNGLAEVRAAQRGEFGGHPMPKQMRDVTKERKRRPRRDKSLGEAASPNRPVDRAP